MTNSTAESPVLLKTAENYLGVEDHADILEACANSAIAAITAVQYSLAKSNDAFRQKWHSLSNRSQAADIRCQAMSGGLKDLQQQADQHVEQLKKAAAHLAALAETSDLKPLFADTTCGRRLNLAWTALTTGDTATLTTILTYAANSLSDCGNADQLFYRLVKRAGIQLAHDGWGAGGFSGERHSSLAFLIPADANQSGLLTGIRVSYDHVFDQGKNIDDKSHTAAVVSGRLENGRLKAEGEANLDADATAAMADRLIQVLTAHYEPTASQ